jgi:superfamily II DNA or RNA helicase
VPLAAPPEPGQLVEVRRRHWIAAEVQASSLPGDGLIGGTQHLVTLTAIDEDSHGESLSVIWELEPGTRVLESASLPAPTGYDRADHLEAFLDAVRWGAATSADRNLLQAPFRSGIQIQAFQLDPLVRALDMARANLLIADDVGLGKTIEAGLVIQELLIRHRARTVLIVVPASLQVKWQTEMRDKFGLEFQIVDTQRIKDLRRQRGIHANPWTAFPRLIASVDWLKSGEGLRLMKDVLPVHAGHPRRFDILVVDEAHNIAPVATKNWIEHSQRTRLIRTLSPHFEHRIFLSATPHNGDQNSFTWLLHLLDEQRFMPGVMPSEAQRQRVVIRRLKTDPEMVDAAGKALYPRRRLEALRVEYSAEEKEIHRLLRDYTESRKGMGGQGGAFIHKLLKKRLFSSPRAFKATLEKHRQSLGRRGKDRTPDPMEMGILRRAILAAEEDYADDREVEAAQDEAVETVSERAAPLTPEQRTMVDRMLTWANSAANGADAKAKAIVAWLDATIRPRGAWSSERVILFTEYRATHAWLHQILVAHGYGEDRLLLLDGGTEPEDREVIKAAFQAPSDRSPARILLATDAASEGIDLQNFCRYMIHVEIPWNPNVLEQRNGRIDRHGQPHPEVVIWHPVGSSFRPERSLADVQPGDLDADLEFLMHAARKVDAIRADLGCVGPVIALQVEQALIAGGGRVDTSAADVKVGKSREWLKRDADLRKRIQDLTDRLQKAGEAMELDPARLERAVQTALALAGKPLLNATTLPSGRRVLIVPPLDGSWGDDLRGLEDPFSHQRRPVTFDHEVARLERDAVLFHLGHRFVQRCLRLLRAQVWSQDHAVRLHRATVRRLPQGMSAAPVAIIRSRLVVTGGDHQRLHEELTVVGGELRDGRFTPIVTQKRIEELLAASQPTELPATDFSTLSARFTAISDDAMKLVEKRSDALRDGLLKRLDERRDREIQDIVTVLDELAKRLKDELDERPKAVQLTLWDDQEKETLQRDLDGYRARLQRLPSERESEIQAIRRRYADPTARTFPVAIEFLIPADTAGGN